MRGTVISSAGTVGNGRITPACAGNSYRNQYHHHLWQDHPRVCGEQRNSGHHKIDGLGSPPRVRGTGAQSRAASPLFRITPACAGNSYRNQYHHHLWQDHPRVCGEQREVRPQVRAILGSPPRVRGTGVLLHWEQVYIRITPACAGNSRRLCFLLALRKDHPRVCGEQGIYKWDQYGFGGSPPRVRGTES